MLIAGCLKIRGQQGGFVLPQSPQQKDSYSELLTIALVGDLLNQADVGLRFNQGKREYRGLFPMLSVSATRFIRFGLTSVVKSL